MKDNIEFVNLIQFKSLDRVVSVLTAEWRLKQSCKEWLTITMCRVESITEKNFANYLSLKILLADAFFEYSPSQTYCSQTSLKYLSWSSQRIKSLSITGVRQWWRMCAGTGDQVMPPVTTRLITGPAEPFYLLLPPAPPTPHHLLLLFIGMSPPWSKIIGIQASGRCFEDIRITDEIRQDKKILLHQYSSNNKVIFIVTSDLKLSTHWTWTGNSKIAILQFKAFKVRFYRLIHYHQTFSPFIHLLFCKEQVTKYQSF